MICETLFDSMFTFFTDTDANRYYQSLVLRGEETGQDKETENSYQ